MKNYCVYQDYTIQETIEKIDSCKDRVAIVVNSMNKVIGVVSQGDIIRALVRGKNLFSSIGGIIQPSFLYLSEYDCAKAYPLFKKKKITLLPVVDDEFKLTGVITLDDIYRFLEGEKV